MARAFWRQWSVRARLLTIIGIPLAYMFCAFVWYAYQSRMAEVREEIAERGPLVAKVLADSAEFSLLAHRYDELKPTLNGLLKSDASIRRIEVQDSHRQTLVETAHGTARAGEPAMVTHVYEAPVLKRLLWVTMLDAGGKRYGQQQDRTADKPPGAAGMTVETMGYVRVTMSASPLLVKQTRRFYVELLVACLGLLVCALLAWQLAKGLDVSLQASMRALREADAEKRRLIHKVHSAVEDERRSIALEVHDELNATLIGVRLEAQRIVELTPAGEVRERAQTVIKLALGLYNSGRTLVRRLRPEVLDMLGLAGALEEMVAQYDRAHAGCRFSLRAEGDFAALQSAVAISAYRIAQEALSNVVKHARATRVELALSCDERGLQLRIADNGIGFEAALASTGIGLVGMRERVYAVHGRIQIDSAIGAGTVITMYMPNQ